LHYHKPKVITNVGRIALSPE